MIGEGKMMTFGNANWGVLGHGDENHLKFTEAKEVKGLAGKKIKDVSVGEYHTLALTGNLIFNPILILIRGRRSVFMGIWRKDWLF
jgi:hypothetical protein